MLFAILVVNLAWAIARLVRHPSADGGMALLLALGLLILFYYTRQFALTVQDRLIRLEMRLRLAKVLPQELVPRIGELSVSQLIGLRFAGDAEITELVCAVLARGITDRTTIKKLVRDWQPDTLRV